MWDTQIRRPSDLGADESLRTESGRAAVGVVRATVVLAGLLFASPAATASDVGPGGDVAFSGQVIERETGKPVEGAEILLERSIRGSAARTLPAWAGTSIIRTDAQGRFRVEFPAEQVAEPRLFIAMRISHPEFISPEIEPGCARRPYPRAGKGRGALFHDDRARARTRVHRPGRGAWGQAGGRYPVRVRTRDEQNQPFHTHHHGRLRGADRRRRPHPHADAENSRVGPLRGTAAQRPGAIPLRSLSALLGYR